jgi:hypothetical protein
MKRAWVWLAVALCGAACMKPNGKGKQLEFGSELPVGVANGLSQDVILPQAVKSTGFQAAFDDTTLAAEGKGLQIIENVRLKSGAYRLRVRCDPASTEVTRELHATVSKNDRPQYDDRWDLHCLNGTAMTFTPSFDVPLAIGGVVSVSVAVTADDANHLGVRVGGHGFTLPDADPMLALGDEEASDTASQLELLALKAGTMPKLSTGALEGQVPLTVIDDAQWVLKTTTAWQPGAVLNVRGDASTVSGGSVTGVAPCAMTVTLTAGQPQTVTSAVCSSDFALSPGQTGQACVAVLRHQDCVSF